MVLSAADIRGVLQGASSLLDVDDPEVLPAAVLEVVDRLVSCDHASYNAIDLAGGRATVLTTGAAPDPEGVRAFAAHAAENPLVAYLHSTGDRAPIRLSDFVTQRQFRRRPIYDLVYRSLGVEHQLAFGVVGQPSEVVGVALNRARGDFTDRDVEVLGLLRPLLEQIWTAIVATRPSTGIRERLDGPRARGDEAASARCYQRTDRGGPGHQREDGRQASRACVRRAGGFESDGRGGPVAVATYVILRIGRRAAIPWTPAATANSTKPSTCSPYHDPPRPADRGLPRQTTPATAKPTEKHPQPQTPPRPTRLPAPRTLPGESQHSTALDIGAIGEHRTPAGLAAGSWRTNQAGGRRAQTAWRWHRSCLLVGAAEAEARLSRLFLSRSLAGRTRRSR